MAMSNVVWQCQNGIMLLHITVCPQWLLDPIHYIMTTVLSPPLSICPNSHRQKGPFLWPNKRHVQSLILALFPSLDEQALKT